MRNGKVRQHDKATLAQKPFEQMSKGERVSAIKYGLRKPMKDSQFPARKRFRQSPNGRISIRRRIDNYHARLRKKILDHYNNRCARCPVTDERVLSIDHIDGRGCDQKREGLSGYSLYAWLVRNKFPKNFQLLCMNCQWVKRHVNREFRARA